MAHVTVLSMLKRSKMPRDPNQLAKMIVDTATGNASARPNEVSKNPAAVALGRLGGLRGGKARAAKLTKQKRVAIAKKAAAKRWAKKKPTTTGNVMKKGRTKRPAR